MGKSIADGGVLFRGMSAGEITRAEALLRAHEKRFKKDEAILLAGAPTTWMGMVLEGGATIESTDVWGNRAILSHVGRGQYFAETYALLASETVPVDVVASRDSAVRFFQIGRLGAIDGAAEPWVAKLVANLLAISAQKNLALSARSFHTASKHVRGRVMAYLNTVSLQRHAKAFDIPFDRQQLADYLNVDRTALSKELGRMRRDGLIAFRKNHFVLP